MIQPATLCIALLLAGGALAEPAIEAGETQDASSVVTSTPPATLTDPQDAAITNSAPSAAESTPSSVAEPSREELGSEEMPPSATTNALETTLPPETEPETPVPPPPPFTKEDLIEAARESIAPAVDAVSIRIDALEHTLAARYQDTMTARLDALEQTLLAQHRDTVAVSKDTTRTILLVAGCFSTAVLLGVLMGALILARAAQRMSEVMVSALPANRQLTAGQTLGPMSETDELAPPEKGPVQEVTHRFLGAIEKLERRIVELEHMSQPGTSNPPKSPEGNGDRSTEEGGNGEPLEFSVSALNQKQYGHESADSQSGQPDPHDHAALWIGKGQALLNLGNAEDALSCFDSALEAGPRHAADAYVKRGLALERLEKLEEALQSYNQAISADESMTLAYLYKGAVCNRLQRYREALDCYENALRCEQKLAEH